MPLGVRTSQHHFDPIGNSLVQDSPSFASSTLRALILTILYPLVHHRQEGGSQYGWDGQQR